ncbi:hypothetical protein B566_EDAN000768 [Ephemera danica]|nr:hypothetical protein B566_EDAN000768 [Ephemera danica]
MDAKLSCCALLLLFVCAAVPTHGWTDEERAFTEYDVDLGHYSQGLLAAETSILQARTAILTLETNFTVKYIAKNITDLFTAMGTPEADVIALQTIMQQRGLAINVDAKRVIDESQFCQESL